MNKFLSLALCCLVLAGCQPETKKTETPEAGNGMVLPKKTKEPDVETIRQFDLKPGRAGQIWVGMPSDSLKKLVPAENLKTTELELEGEKYPAYEIRNVKTGNQLLLLAEESCKNGSCSVFRLRVLSPKFSTKENIRVGSTFGDVKKACKLSFVGLGEADFVAVSEEKKMTFTLDISKFPPKPLYKIKTEDIPENTPVTSILLF
jgi:hypothetical protein